MAVRTDADAVRAIMDNISLLDAEIDVYIAIANPMVTSTLGGGDLTGDQLTEIERWLSAHLIAMTRERMGETEKVGEASIKYIGKFGMKWESTPYGQMVLVLDTSGAFAKQGKQAISINAVTSFED